jgi:hypothetical protein
MGCAFLQQVASGGGQARVWRAAIAGRWIGPQHLRRETSESPRIGPQRHSYQRHWDLRLPAVKAKGFGLATGKAIGARCRYNLIG